MPISNSPYLRVTVGLFGLFAVGLGINALFNPPSALSLFQFSHPSARAPANSIESAADGKLVDSLMMLYGARDVALGTTLISTAYFGSRKACAGVVLSGTFVALMDGFVSLRQIGRGQWDHWVYVPLGVVVAGLLAGIAD